MPNIITPHDKSFVHKEIETAMNEWEFTGDVNSWINEILGKTPIFPFDRSKVEQLRAGSPKRSDLTLLDASKRPVLTGEIKLPYQADGSSPHVGKVVQDARRKAKRAKARFFFTWNVNECVLWETEPADTTKLGQDYRSWQVCTVSNDTQLEHRSTEETIRRWLPKFLHSVAQVLEGTAALGRKAPDEKFVEAMESALKMPVQFTYDELESRYKIKRERARIDKWMREDQGWTIFTNPEGVRENLERASRFACYALVNKLVFYEALLKRYSGLMDKLQVQSHVGTGQKLWAHLEEYFQKAIKITGDYETIFGVDHRSIGNQIPYYSDKAVVHWRELIEQIHEFDFSKLDFEVIGTLFERLLSPEERHKYGQHYTRVEIVDLINAFCIRRGDERVMDPACGGGTFLVRAYARKRVLNAGIPHGELLKHLYGVDIMNFATHLSTMNLAIRDLIDDENYPQVVRGDFFDVAPDKIFATLPKKATAHGSGKAQRREVEIPALDAVVGNPPYIRQEEIPKAKKPVYKDQIKQETGLELSGRSDIHCYFWPHAAIFLKPEGYLCLLTSSQWLDVEYGFKLQDWLLKNFEILAIFESIDEPWFVGARVATTVSILRKQSDERKRMENLVRFVQLRRPIAEILANDGTNEGAFYSAEEFRDEILALTQNTVNERYRARLVRQGNLWDDGVALSKAMGKGEESYYGGKWGIHLRAPDVWFSLLDLSQHNWVSLSSLVDIRRGITSGKDSFFFPRDCTEEFLSRYPEDAEFESETGVTRRLAKSGAVKLVRCGDGYATTKSIEAKYLEPELHSLMEVDGFVALPENCARQILLVHEKRDSIRGEFARDYIEWGEANGVHHGSTCASRQTETREWYDLTGHNRGIAFWPMAQQYKHAVPSNKHNLICNHNLFDIFSGACADDVLIGILNSTFVVLSKYQYGRPVGVEGNLKTEVVDVNMMKVPDPSAATTRLQDRVAAAMKQMSKRKALQFLSERRMRRMAYTQKGKEHDLQGLSDSCEIDMPDRRELDDAVLEMMGVKNKKQRTELIDELYSYLREFFEQTRAKEEKAIANKNVAKRRGILKPVDVAREILEEIEATETRLLQNYDDAFLDKRQAYDAFDIPDDGDPRPAPDMFSGAGVKFVKNRRTTGHVETRHKSQDDLITLLVQEGIRGLTRVPLEEAECKRVRDKFAKFLNERDSRLKELVVERTSDEDLQEKILVSLKALVKK